MHPRRIHSSLTLLVAVALLASGCQLNKSAPAIGVTALKPGANSGDDTPSQPGDRPTSKPADQTPAGEEKPLDPPGPVAQVPDITPSPLVPGGTSGSDSPLLFGTVGVPQPLIGDHGTGIISNNGSALIGNNGGAIIGNNGGNIISNNGSSFISKTKYRLLGNPSGPDGYLADALMYLTNRDEKFFRNPETNEIFHTLTTSTGQYAFDATAPGFPLDKDVVVNALVPGNLRLTGFIIPTRGETPLRINLATTLGTEFLRGHAYALGKPLSAFNRSTFVSAINLTQSAIESGAIEAVKVATDQDGNTLHVGTFDLRLDHTYDLRNQYVAAISAVAKTNSAVKAISDAWKAILGFRPTAVTTVAGNGEYPRVEPFVLNVEGNGEAPDLKTTPMGVVLGLAVSARGDIFVGAASDGNNRVVAPSSGHIRWLRPNGDGTYRVSALWLPDYRMASPYGIAIEKEPTDDQDNNPGVLLVSDIAANRVYRVPIVDHPILGADLKPKHKVEVVAGENTPAIPLNTSADNPAHPTFVELAADHPVVGAAGKAKTSRWRLSDEGARRYVKDNTPIVNPARYAHLDSPWDVKIDELGNIFIADLNNHRVRMIPKVAGNYFDYRQPEDANSDGIVDGFGAPVTMQPNCIYTIVGHPQWDEVRTAASANGRWFGEYAGDNGRAQEAKLDKPMSLAWRNGYLYINDFDNNRIRRVSRSTGLIDTIVGKPVGAQRVPAPGIFDYDYAPGTAGDGGPAADAQLAFPRAIVFDAQGRLYINDNGSGRIRMVGTDGTITTIAGRKREPSAASTGFDNHTDGDALNWCDLFDTQFLGVDPDNNIVFTDFRHLRVRKLWRQWE